MESGRPRSARARSPRRSSPSVRAGKRRDKARMLQSEDIGDLIRYIACLPSRVCLNDVLITPTWNRAYISAQDQGF
jgi:NADP-dependent 3-hydroxy acid dehydrogenase YdfG